MLREHSCDAWQALSLGYAVRMQGGMPGCTPAIITPPFISPAGADEPGATPMHDATPEVGHIVPEHSAYNMKLQHVPDMVCGAPQLQRAV